MKAEPLTLTGPRRRPDRLVAISGRRARDLKLEYSIDAGATWCPATVYVGETNKFMTEAWEKMTIGCVPATEALPPAIEQINDCIARGGAK